MNKISLPIVPSLLILLAFSVPVRIDVVKTMKIVEHHLTDSRAQLKDTTRFPRNTKPDGSLHLVPSRDWTSGFYPGNLWYLYEYTNDKQWEQAARRWTAALEKEKFNKRTHDLGFMLFCSFGNGYRLTKDESYKEILIEGAKSLSSRFNENVGCIRSWDHGKWQFPVIIDNMMNLELLFWATKVTGDSSFYDIAVTHANTTMEHHFRDDHSSYHVIDYDTLTGNPRFKGTHQGYADNSPWARGQAWGLYGFTVMYRETRDSRYLEQARKIADYFINHKNTPKDRIPYWDFEAPEIPNEERDASAAAIAASGMLELSQYVKDGKKYYQSAEQILKSLSSPDYLASPGSNNNFILKHSVGHKPGNIEIDTPLVYADYYFIESLIRYAQLNKSEKGKL